MAAAAAAGQGSRRLTGVRKKVVPCRLGVAFEESYSNATERHMPKNALSSNITVLHEHVTAITL